MKIKKGPAFFRTFFRGTLLAVSATVLVLSAFPAEGLCSIADRNKKEEATLAKPVVQGLEYLLGLVVDKSAAFEPSKVQEVISYVDSSAPTDELIKLPRYDSANGAGMRMDVHAGLKRILEYAYNPAIPNYAVYPSVIRISGWLPGSQFFAQRVEPWKYLDDCYTPKVWRGREYEVNTPDSFGGAYYKYDLERLMVLMKYQGRNVFISISRQLDKSSVGRKGLVVDDNQWNYFYSGIPGLTTGGMGWMDTYMYSSASVYVYIEDPDNSENTVNFLFKWLKAGWAGLNVVRPKHIFEGSQRFANAFKVLMESSDLPSPEVLAGRVGQIEAMSDEAIALKMDKYAKAVEKMSSRHPELSDEFPEVYEDGKYADEFTREERIGILVKEYVKQAMGKQCLIPEDVVEN